MSGLGFSSPATSTAATSTGFFGPPATKTTTTPLGFALSVPSSTGQTPTVSFGATKPTLGLNAPLSSAASSGTSTTPFSSLGGVKLGFPPLPLSQNPGFGTAPALSLPTSAPNASVTPAQSIAQGSVLGSSVSMGAVSKPGGLTSALQIGASSSLPAAGTAGSSSLAALGAKPTTAATTATTSAAGAASTASTGPKMTYKELEDQMNKWWMELEHQELVFLEQATRVNAWDKVLIENGQKITELNADVEKVKLDQHRLNHELDFIVAQQKELEEILVPLEENVAKLPPINYQQHTDSERERTYQIAENIDAQLKRMTEDLKEVIDHLNTGVGSQDSSDPMLQISKILNAHMESLQWVDHNAAVLQRKTEEVARYADYTKKEHERNFRLAYS